MAERARALGPGISAALIVADHRTGEIRARIGAADRLDPSRGGFVDMSRAVRSPGSTLKPLVYGLAFEAGIAHPETVVEDRPMRFGGYAPQNLDRIWLGPITARTALQASRNLPAVALLDAVGPAQLMARLRRAGGSPQLPPGGTPGLSIALGGVGVTLEDLVRLYAAIANGGTVLPLPETPGAAPAVPARALDAVPAWYVADILLGTPPPPNGVAGRIAYKTGTSYGHRDAWAIGFDGAHVVGIWIGRPDGASVPGALGLEAAAPALFDAFARLAPEPTALPPAPAGALTVTTAELPAPLRAFHARGAADAGGGPEIAFPPDGARVDLGLGRGAGRPLAIRLGAGVPPFRWLVDGAPVTVDPFARQTEWRPDGIGFVDLAVIDATGRAARTSVFLQ
jgi:penicillin-binding protein 1C